MLVHHHLQSVGNELLMIIDGHHMHRMTIAATPNVLVFCCYATDIVIETQVNKN